MQTVPSPSRHAFVGPAQDKGVRCDGFWVTRWAQEHTREEREAMIGKFFVCVSDIYIFVDLAWSMSAVDMLEMRVDDVCLAEFRFFVQANIYS